MFDWLANHEYIGSFLIMSIAIGVSCAMALWMGRATVIEDEHATRFRDRAG